MHSDAPSALLRPLSRCICHYLAPLLLLLLTSCASQQHLRLRARYGPLPDEPQALAAADAVASKAPAASAHAAADALGLTLSGDDDVALLQACAAWLGTPYAYGGTTPQGIDCSALTHHIYTTVYGCSLHRSSADQYDKDVRHHTHPRQLRQGDLVFFTTPRSHPRPGHVGIYLKDRKFIHASSSRGVVVDHLDQPYWQKHWLGSGTVKR